MEVYVALMIPVNRHDCAFDKVLGAYSDKDAAEQAALKAMCNHEYCAYEIFKVKLVNKKVHKTKVGP